MKIKNKKSEEIIESKNIVIATGSKPANLPFIKIDKERSVDVIITRLRKKIEENPKNPNYLQTIRVEGYVLWIE